MDLNKVTFNVSEIKKLKPNPKTREKLERVSKKLLENSNKISLETLWNAYF